MGFDKKVFFECPKIFQTAYYWGKIPLFLQPPHQSNFTVKIMNMYFEVTVRES